MSIVKKYYSFGKAIPNSTLSGCTYRCTKSGYSLLYPLFLSAMLSAPAVSVMAQQQTEASVLQIQVDQAQAQTQSQIFSLQNHQELVVTLDSNPASGYSWELENDNPNSLPVQLVSRKFQPESDLLGAPGKLKLSFKGKWAGTAELRFVYRRPGEQFEWPTDQLKVNVQTVGQFSNYIPKTGGSPKATGFLAGIQSNEAAAMVEEVIEDPVVNKRPPAPAATHPPQKSSLAPSLSASVLPTTFNWCINGACTPVKNQGACGSCWAFSTVGSFEASLLKNTSQTKDLSEQYLISCNSDKWSCSGGWFAHNYHLNKKITGEPDAGAVYEADFPYRATNGACNPPHTHHEKLASWKYVQSSNPYSVPSVQAIKDAIYQYGPVSAAVCVGPLFQKYNSKTGVFGTNESCGTGKVNHAIVLVGWDDSQGVWYLRNSWGTSWGESGYMQIKYNISNVGYAANYVTFSAPYELTISKAGAGTVASSPAGINCGSDCNENYASGKVVTLTATPATGSSFAGWSGGACSGAGSCQVTMTQAQTVTATFNAK